MITSASISPLKVARTGSGTSSIRRTVPAAWSPGSPVSTSAAALENALLLAWGPITHVVVRPTIVVSRAGSVEAPAEAKAAGKLQKKTAVADKAE